MSKDDPHYGPQIVPGRATRIGVAYCGGPECGLPHIVLYDANGHGYADAVIDEAIMRSLVKELEKAFEIGLKH
jgi:hypothetical protein